MQIQKEKGAKERKIKANDDAEVVSSIVYLLMAPNQVDVKETEGEVREAAAVTIQVC